MTIALPNPNEVEQYGVQSAPPEGESRSGGIPLIADDEAVCQVRVLETGSGAYWSRGDVDVHVLHAKQYGLTHGLVPQASLAVALRERRQLRRRLARSGVQTTATGLVLFNSQTQLLVPARP